jgi:hypothetical protein
VSVVFCVLLHEACTDVPKVTFMEIVLGNKHQSIVQTLATHYDAHARLQM